EDRVARAIAFELAIRLALRRRLSERQRLALREHVGHQQVVMIAQRGEALAESDEVARDELRALMDQLVERMLTVGAGLAPVDRAGLIRDSLAVSRDALATALHGELL